MCKLREKEYHNEVFTAQTKQSRFQGKRLRVMPEVARTNNVETAVISVLIAQPSDAHFFVLTGTVLPSVVKIRK